MKPRSKIERQFVEWAGLLPPLDARRRDWARGLFPAEALYHSRRGNHCEFHCMCCGAVVPTLGKWNLQEDPTWTCEECGTECKVLNQSGEYAYQRTAPTTSRYVTLSTVYRDTQVFRTFEVYRWNGRTIGADGRPAGCPTEFMYFEVWQNWILPDGREVITHRPYHRSYNSFSWDHCGEWGIGRHNAHCSGYYGFDDVFDISGNWYFPGTAFTPLLRRNGMRARLLRIGGLNAAALSSAVLRDNLMEELVKSGQERLAAWLLDHRGTHLQDIIHAVRICNRNGYRIKDPGLWTDYLDDLTFLGWDTHNAHYVCPASLRKAHARTTRLREREEERRREAERLAEIAKWEPRYAVAKAPFLGIVLSDGDITLTVIPTVAEVREEGKAMHHCVFAQNYWKKPDTVLLSARDEKGGRIETVEIGLDPYRVRQSRGLLNKATPMHKRIVALCEANMDTFRKAARKMTVPLHLTGENRNFYQD